MTAARFTQRMNTLQALFLLVAGLSVAPTVKLELLFQFRSIIQCANPDSSPLLDFTDYGCYCGLGGSGTPVDDLDRCCQVHDECYAYANILRVCWTFWDNPYTEIYDYTCNKKKKLVTCTKRNNKCEKFICQCDRKAAECFARSQWNPDHVRLASEHCE